MSAELALLHADHVRTLCQRSARALERSGRAHLLIAAGAIKYRFLDDMPFPFQVNPHFKAWLPLTEHPGCWLRVTPGEKPHLLYFQPEDFWHMPPADPEGYWTNQFSISIVRDHAELARLLPPASKCAIVGEADATVGDYVPDNPASVLDYLHFHRAYKTPYELALMRSASQRAVRGHRAAEAAFRAGASEHGIHQAYLVASGHSDIDLPYGNIVGLNSHAAVLHYQHRDTAAPDRQRSLLIDAGASCAGYAADITRTYSAQDDEFAALVAAVDRVQLDLVNQVRPGRDYRDLHLECHRLLTGVLIETGVIRCGQEEALELQLSSTFFPHGLGHLIGLQVHDVAGFAASDGGGRTERPDGHPFLRLTRVLEPAMAVTIEPGLYFIDSLMQRLRSSAAGHRIEWARVEAFAPYGGVRIEDDVVCTDGAPENLSRDAFALSA
jgi:Xaa-Pro dipeptidase